MTAAATPCGEMGSGAVAVRTIHADTLGNVFRTRGGGLAAWQVRRVTEYMNANLDRQIALAELAALVRLSRFHFCTAFRRTTGQTPRNWLTDRRIERAANLLADSRRSVTEIALEVGYDTPSSFTARFRQRMGVTPSEYRRAL